MDGIKQTRRCANTGFYEPDAEFSRVIDDLLGGYEFVPS